MQLKLKKPFPLTLEALGKLSSYVPFIMPEHIAKTDAFQSITETVGLGPFKFVKEEWRSTIANALKRESIEPAPERGGRTSWPVFLKAH